MSFLVNHCTLLPLTNSLLTSCSTFDCGNVDLNEFFAKDCVNYNDQLLGKTYCFLLDEDPSQIVCKFTVSNDSIKTASLPNNRARNLSKQIPHPKRHISFPAILIGRLGVSEAFKQRGIGIELMDFIKAWFADTENKTGCRFVVVDAYNEEGPIRFYQKSGFQFLFSTEEQERSYTNNSRFGELSTRLMYYDLIQLKTI